MRRVLRGCRRRQVGNPFARFAFGFVHGNKICDWGDPHIFPTRGFHIFRLALLLARCKRTRNVSLSVPEIQYEEHRTVVQPQQCCEVPAL